MDMRASDMPRTPPQVDAIAKCIIVGLSGSEHTNSFLRYGAGSGIVVHQDSAGRQFKIEITKVSGPE